MEEQTQGMPESQSTSMPSDEEIELRKRLAGVGVEDAKHLREIASLLDLDQLVPKLLQEQLSAHALPDRRLSRGGRKEALAALIIPGVKEMLSGEVNADYVARRVQIGQLYAEVNLEVKWFAGLLNGLVEGLMRALMEHPEIRKDPLRGWRGAAALSKRVSLDLITVIDSYSEYTVYKTIRLQEETLRMQSEAIRELASPIVEVWDNILALPIVGSVDSKRAQDITESLLNSASEKRAQVMIIDITGLPVLDTSTANHILKAVQALELLGTQAIITGVRPAIAQTVVSLGINTSLLRTRARLVDGLRLALQLVENGKAKIPGGEASSKETTAGLDGGPIGPAA